MAQKEYLKMADTFVGEVFIDSDCLLSKALGEIADFSGYNNECRYIAHAINSHDELAAEVERLRELAEKAFIDGCEAGFALSAEGVNGEHNVVRYEQMMNRFKSALVEYKKGL